MVKKISGIFKQKSSKYSFSYSKFFRFEKENVSIFQYFSILRILASCIRRLLVKVYHLCYLFVRVQPVGLDFFSSFAECEYEKVIFDTDMWYCVGWCRIKVFAARGKSFSP